MPARRTMPNGSGCDRSFARICGPSSGNCPNSIRHSLASYSASRDGTRRSLGRKRVRLPDKYGLSFARAASLRARWACRVGLRRFDRLMAEPQCDHGAMQDSIPIVVAVGRGDEPRPDFRLRIVLAHQAPDFLVVHDEALLLNYGNEETRLPARLIHIVVWLLSLAIFPAHIFVNHHSLKS